ncbi:19201_t:CDS:2, partial [Gigaspora margarita]
HYYALLKPEKNRKWLKFEDNFIIPVTDKEVLESSYRGKGSNVLFLSVIQTCGRNVKRFINTYMLVYICECDIENILLPVQPQDIPDYLHECLNEERTLYEQRKKEDNSYLPAKIVTPNNFACHQGFDLANFNDQQYPLSDVPLFKVLKIEQIRFWIFVKCQNKTARPDTLISDDFIDMTMKEIHTEMASKQNKLKLFLEVAYRPINDKSWFLPIEEENSHVIVFFKYFNTDTQSLDYVRDIIPILCEKKKYPPHTPLKIYKEIKPKMIEELDPNLTFQQSEIDHSNIICFQKVLTDEM